MFLHFSPTYFTEGGYCLFQEKVNFLQGGCSSFTRMGALMLGPTENIALGFQEGGLNPSAPLTPPLGSAHKKCFRVDLVCDAASKVRFRIDLLSAYNNLKQPT